jgi:hypothetical protein
VDWWSLFARSWAIYSLYFSRSFTVRSRFVFGRFMACFTVRSRFVFGSSSALLARRVLVLFVFEMDFVLVWTLVLWYIGPRFFSCLCRAAFQFFVLGVFEFFVLGSVFC